MGITSSKHDENGIQKGENIADQTLVSISSGASGSSVSSFQRLKNLSINNRYERFPNVYENAHSLSMNNLEGELTPKKTPNSGLKQRLIKALGGYNLLDPRSPNQLITRTPLAFEKQAQNNENKLCLRKKNLILETSIGTKECEIENINDNPYSIFEENLNEQPVKKEENQSEAPEVAVDLFDGLVISKDPRSPSDGIPRTPLSFAIGTLQTPSIEMQQSFTRKEQEKSNTISKNNETKQEKSVTQTLIKSIYKDLIHRDPIHRNLIHEEENEADVSRTTPIKKSTTIKVRTPLSCVANKNHAIRSGHPKNLLENGFEDNFSPKIDSLIHGDENTPIQMGTNGQKLGRMTTNSVSKSKSKIPVIRSRRLH